MEQLGNPERHFSAVHIGGTNGKGSVATMVYTVLSRAGLNVGLYTSPHLVDVRERMLVDGSPIPRDAFVHWTAELQPAITEYDASFFEATTAIALADFAGRGVEIAVIEVGLGGRLDATNVVAPLVSAVTNVSLEHTEYLGDSCESIAWEKAGIAKRDTPFVIGEQDPGLVKCLREAAEERGAIVHELPEGSVYSGPVSLVGAYQRRNASVAEAILELVPASLKPSSSEITDGIAVAHVPGRFDRRGKWLFDVAHNLAGIEGLVQQMRVSNLPGPVHALVGIAGDKEWERVLPTLRGEIDTVWLTVAPSMPTERSPDLDQMVAEIGLDLNVEPDFDAALNHIQRAAGTVLVTGSFFTVGDALSRLPGFAPLG